MRRSSLPRSTKPMKRGAMRKRNAKRAARMLVRNFGPPEFREFTHLQPCAMCGEAPRQWWNRAYFGNDCAHVKDRGMGGCNSSDELVIAACPPCHDSGKPRGLFAKAREHQRRWKAYLQSLNGGEQWDS